MWVFRLRHGPQEEGPRPPPGADLLWGYAGTVSLRTARAVRGSQRHALRTNPSMTVTPCSRYSTRSCHIQTSEQAVVVFPRRVRVRHRVSPSMCHVPCRSRERAMACSVPSGRKCCDQCVSSVKTLPMILARISWADRRWNGSAAWAHTPVSTRLSARPMALCTTHLTRPERPPLAGDHWVQGRAFAPGEPGLVSMPVWTEAPRETGASAGGHAWCRGLSSLMGCPPMLSVDVMSYAPETQAEHCRSHPLGPLSRALRSPCLLPASRARLAAAGRQSTPRARHAAAFHGENGMPRVYTLPASWVARPRQGKAKGQPRCEQPIRRATAESPPDPCINDRLEPGGLPEHAEEARVVGGLPLDAFAVDLPRQPHGGPDGQFRNHAPDTEGTCLLAVDPTPEVQMEGERGHPEAHNADALKAKPLLARHGRGQQQPQLYGHTHPRLLLEDALPQDRLQGQSRVNELQPSLRPLLALKLTDEFHGLRQTVVEDHLRNHEGLLALGAYERQIPQLDFHPGALDHRGIGRDKWPVPPRRGGQESQEHQHERTGACGIARVSVRCATTPHTPGSPHLVCPDGVPPDTADRSQAQTARSAPRRP